MEEKITIKGIGRQPKEKEEIVEVARSFSYKLNLGNYSNVDFFCSQKAECNENDVKETSARLHEFCKNEVIKSINAYKKDMEPLINKKSAILEKAEKTYEVRDEVNSES